MSAVISRAQWGARAAQGTGNAISARPLGVAIHYSEGNLGTSPDSECDDKVRGIQTYHMDTKGWADIAYSYIVCPHGNVFVGRGVGKGSAANGTTKGNVDWYAVCALGGSADKPTTELLGGIGTAIGLCRKAGAAVRVVGHRDLSATACPGAALYALVKARHWNATVPRTAPSAPSRGDTRPPIPAKTLLTVNGTLDTPTRKRLQRWVGVSADGVLGPVSMEALRVKVGASRVGYVWLGLQRIIGVTQDNRPGPITYTALQRYLNQR